VKHTALLLVSTLLLCGCPHQVHLTVQNQVAPTLDISAVAKNKNGAQTGTTHLGSAAQNKSVSGAFKVDNGGTYTVQAGLGSGSIVYSGSEKTVTGDLTDTVTIDHITGRRVDTSDTSLIDSDFGQLGPDIGFNPVTVDSGVPALFGALIYYSVKTDQDPGQEPTVMASPDQLTGSVKSSDINYPASHVSNETNITTDASVKVGASVPLWGSLAAHFEASSVYDVKWTMDGFGNVDKGETGAPYQDKINALSPLVKSDICKKLKNPNARIVYVNRIYIVRDVHLTYQQGQKIQAGVVLSGGSIISGDTAYDFSTSQTKESEVGNDLVNIAGPTWTGDTMPICQSTPHLESAAQTQFVPGTPTIPRLQPSKVDFK
jgi:hypothetical protein